MADKETSTFPKMGESIIGNVVNISGQRSPYTKPSVKEGFAKNDNPANSKHANKGASLVKNAQGPEPHIQATIDYPNSEEHNKVLRNVKRVQGPYARELSAAAGNPRFADKGMEKGYTQGV